MVNDLRYLKIEKNIRQAFLELLDEKKYPKITVTDICKRASCSRNAFYLHYESKENLYDAIVLDIVLDIEKSCQPIVDKLSDIGRTESKAYVTNILSAVEMHRPALKQLLENEQVHFSKHLNKIMVEAMHSNSKNFQEEANLDYIHYFAGGITSFIEYWITDSEYDLATAKETLFGIIL
ncbi:TetR/AcrR family transcriptional regulator [Streptococcus cameli]